MNALIAVALGALMLPVGIMIGWVMCSTRTSRYFSQLHSEAMQEFVADMIKVDAELRRRLRRQDRTAYPN